MHLHWLAKRVGPNLLYAAVITTGPEAYRLADGIGVMPARISASNPSDRGARPLRDGAVAEPLPQMPPGRVRQPRQAPDHYRYQQDGLAAGAETSSVERFHEVMGDEASPVRRVQGAPFANSDAGPAGNGGRQGRPRTCRRGDIPYRFDEMNPQTGADIETVADDSTGRILGNYAMRIGAIAPNGARTPPMTSLNATV